MKKKLILTLMLCLFSINCQARADESKYETKDTSNEQSAGLNGETNKPSAELNNETKISSDEQSEESDDELKIPPEVKPFVEKDTKAIRLESADLNGDKTKDYILVLEKLNPKKDAGDFPVNQRPLIILVRDKNNKLSAVKRNEKMIMCSECGGVMGDPFAGVEAGEKTFTVNHYGGSGIRWSARYKFNYSRIDRTWQLVEVEKESFSAGNVDDKTSTVLKPKDFGKIDIADFDPDRLQDK